MPPREEAGPHTTDSSFVTAALQLFARYDSLRLRTYREHEGHAGRIRLTSFGSADALRFDDVGYFNRIYSPDQSAAQRLSEIELFYRGCRFGCELIGPQAGSAGQIDRACRDRGWVPGDRYAWLHAPLSTATESIASHPFTIRRPEVHERTSFILSYLNAFEATPDRFAPALRNMRHLFDLPELEFLMAWHGAEPAGIGMLYRVGKSAVLCAGATLPAYRRRGCHSALLAARIKLAREHACDEIFSWAKAGSQSHANMERAGLRTVGITEAWRMDHTAASVHRRPLARSERAADNGFQPRLGFQPFSPDDAESSIGTRFREAALRRADSVALVDGAARLTYRELLRCSAGIAAGLRARLGSVPGTVGILLPFGAQTVQAILGILLSGCSYFPLESAQPDSQLEALARAASLAGIVVDPATRQRFQTVSPSFAGQLLDIADLLQDEETLAPADSVQPRSVAALYATSGTTGEPKLAALPHRAILFDIGRQTNDLYLGPDDRFDLLFSFAFSASLAPMFGALLNGAELHLLDLNDSLSELVNWLERSQITISTMTVSMLRSVCIASHKTGICPVLRLLSAGGEPLLGSDVSAFRSVFAPSCVLQNAMAATETRTYAQYFVPRNGPAPAAAPIGWPVNGKQVVLVDEHGSPVGEGEEGEITVCSRYLANGYANDAALTQKCFAAAADGTTVYRTGDYGRFSPDGSLLFLGRKDSRVKIRGHRVELQAIEHALEQHPALIESAVVAREDARGELRIVAYCVPRASTTVTSEELHAFLQHKLPDYMLPWSFVVLNALPRSVNGKVDRERLPLPAELGEPRPRPAAAPANSTLATLMEIWSNALRKTCTNPRDNFYDLGGDSLSALRLQLEIQERFGCDLPPASLRTHPTAEQLAQLIDATRQGKAARRRLLTFNADGSRPPIFFVHPIGGSAQGYQPLALTLGADQPSYGLCARTWEDVDPHMSIESLASEYIDEISAVTEQGEPLVLAGYSLGATVAFEMAQQLAAAGEAPPLVVAIDMPAVNAPGLRRQSWLRMLGDVALNLPSWSAHHALRMNPKNLLIRLQGRIAMLLARESQFSPKVYFGVAEVPASYHAFCSAMYDALMRYKPRPYSGRIVLLRAKVPTLFRNQDPQMGWQRIAGDRVEVLPVPGSHTTCVMQPFLFELASVLRQRL